MSKTQTHKKKKSLLVIILLAVTYVAGVITVGFGYLMPGGFEDVVPGMPSPAEFRAPRQIVNFYAMEAAQDAAAAAVESSWMRNLSITEQILRELEEFFVAIGELRAEYLPLLSPIGPVPPGGVGERPLPDASGLTVELNQDQIRRLITGDSPTFAGFVEALTELYQYYLESGLTTVSPTAASIVSELSIQGFDEIYTSIGHTVSTEILRPNMVVDQEATEAARQEARNNVDNQYFFAGQTIVRTGDIVTPEAYRALIELGYIGGDGAIILVGVAGSALVVTIVLGVAVLYIYLFMREIAANRRRVLLLFTLFMFTLALLRVMVPLDYYLTPIMLFAMLVSILIDRRLAIMLTVAASLIAVAMNPAEITFLSYGLINGIFAAMIAKQVVGRGRIVMTFMIMGGVNAATVAANYFMVSGTFSMEVVNSAIFAMGGGFFSILLCIGLLPLLESLFEVVTSNKLLELTNPDNPLLRHMVTETPGTYHHSLVVANLSETACYDIGANHALARVGAYYHDIGKMKYPQYFAENQSGTNPHDALPPRTSVEVIVDHVTRGLELARQYRLPQQIRAFIAEHHGSSMMKVFYHKEKTRNPDEEINDKDFRYKHNIPQSRESAVVMIADTCEAAVRSTVSSKGKDMEAIETLVRKLIKDKLDDGQLDESGLSIKDLDTIAKAFMRVFKGMYHERVPYPSGTVKELVEGPAAKEEKEGGEGEGGSDEKVGDFDRK